MIIYELNNPTPLDRKNDYQSGNYSIKIKSGHIYIFLEMKQVKKIKLTNKNLDKELYRYGYEIRR